MRCPPAASSSRRYRLYPTKSRRDIMGQRLVRSITNPTLRTAAKGAGPSGETVSAIATEACVESGGALRARRLAGERLVRRNGALCILADISEEGWISKRAVVNACGRGRSAYACRSGRRPMRCWSSSRPRTHTSLNRPAAGSCQSGKLRIEKILRRKARLSQKNKSVCAKRRQGDHSSVAFTIAHEGGPGRDLVVAAVHTRRDDAASRATGDARARVGVEVGLVAECRARCSRRRQAANDVHRTS